MTVGLLLITHNRLGDELLGTARAMLGTCPLPAEAVAVHRSDQPEEVTVRAADIAARLDDGDGVLVLTDMYGSTPSNIAHRLCDGAGGLDGRMRAVAGLNLPMLVRVLNYPQLALDGLVEKALSGGREGILCGRDREEGR